MPFPRPPFRSSRLLPALAFLCLIMGCLFESDNYVPEPRYSLGLLDTLYPSTSTAVRTVELFQPLRDPSLAGKAPAAPEILPPVNVKDHATGDVIRYRLIRQRFGNWSRELEFKWNYFLLQVYFLFPSGVPDTAGLAGDTDSLYSRINETDAFTHYFDSAAAPGAMDRLTKTTKPGALGIEVGLNGTEDSVVVRRVVAGSPAGRAGMAKGMILLAVDDSTVTGDSAIERFSRFSAGDSGQASYLTVLGTDGMTRNFRIVREPVAFPTVYVDSLDGVGYISITGFMPATLKGQSTATEFKSALAATRRFPVTILDLRDNGGGSLDLTMKMCDEILPAGAVVIRQHQRQFSEVDHVPLVSLVNHLATSAGSAEGRKFVQIANGRSASASEIFLVALQEGASAPIVGQKTYGKGVGQNVRNTPGHGLAVVTFLKFTSRTGLDYHKSGIVPDYPDTATGDRLLARAVAVAKARIKPAAKAAARPDLKDGMDEAGKPLAGRARAVEWNRLQQLRPGIHGLEAPLRPSQRP